MMTLTARLCALCAVCALSEMALVQERGRTAIRMIGGMLMLRLVMTDAQALCRAVLAQPDLEHIFQALIG